MTDHTVITTALTVILTKSDFSIRRPLDCLAWAHTRLWERPKQVTGEALTSVC